MDIPSLPPTDIQIPSHSTTLYRPSQRAYEPPIHRYVPAAPPFVLPAPTPETFEEMARPQLPQQPLIPASILTSNVSHQLQSSLFSKLPTEILHRILLLAIERPTTNQSHDMITRVFITLTSKLLANHLAAACSALPSNTPGMSGGGVLQKKDIPRNFYTKTAPSAHQNPRINFMDKLGLWLRPEDGWALCAVCLAYKQTKNGGLGAEKGSWRSMKKVNNSGTRMVRAAGDVMRMVRNFVIAIRSPKDLREEEDLVRIKVEDADGADGADNETWKTNLIQQGWMEMGEEHLICPKHRFTAQQMIQLRDK